eukprot:gene6348-4574_t
MCRRDTPGRTTNNTFTGEGLVFLLKTIKCTYQKKEKEKVFDLLFIIYIFISPSGMPMSLQTLLASSKKVRKSSPITTATEVAPPSPVYHHAFLHQCSRGRDDTSSSSSVESVLSWSSVHLLSDSHVGGESDETEPHKKISTAPPCQFPPPRSPAPQTRAPFPTTVRASGSRRPVYQSSLHGPAHPTNRPRRCSCGRPRSGRAPSPASSPTPTATRPRRTAPRRSSSPSPRCSPPRPRSSRSSKMAARISTNPTTFAVPSTAAERGWRPTVFARSVESPLGSVEEPFLSHQNNWCPSPEMSPVRMRDEAPPVPSIPLPPPGAAANAFSSPTRRALACGFCVGEPSPDPLSHPDPDTHPLYGEGAQLFHDDEWDDIGPPASPVSVPPVVPTTARHAHVVQVPASSSCPTFHTWGSSPLCFLHTAPDPPAAPPQEPAPLAPGSVPVMIATAVPAPWCQRVEVCPPLGGTPPPHTHGGHVDEVEANATPLGGAARIMCCEERDSPFPLPTLHIYIYIERERERDENRTCVVLYVSSGFFFCLVVCLFSFINKTRVSQRINPPQLHRSAIIMVIIIIIIAIIFLTPPVDFPYTPLLFRFSIIIIIIIVTTIHTHYTHKHKHMSKACAFCRPSSWSQLVGLNTHVHLASPHQVKFMIIFYICLEKEIIIINKMKQMPCFTAIRLSVICFILLFRPCFPPFLYYCDQPSASFYWCIGSWRSVCEYISIYIYIYTSMLLVLLVPSKYPRTERITIVNLFV